MNALSVFWPATQRHWKSIGNTSPLIGANLSEFNLCDGFLCCKSSGINSPFFTETMKWTANIWPWKTTGDFSQNQLALLKSWPSASFFVGLRWNKTDKLFCLDDDEKMVALFTCRVRQSHTAGNYQFAMPLKDNVCKRNILVYMFWLIKTRKENNQLSTNVLFSYQLSRKVALAIRPRLTVIVIFKTVMLL